jgi:lipoprotein-releasing system permease protein
MPEVAYYTQTIEENTLIKYKDREYIATIKGVEPEFRLMTGIDSMVSDGTAQIENKSANFALLGQGVAYYLSANISDFSNPLTLYVPKKLESVSYDPLQAFNSQSIFPCGIFSIQQDFDIKYVLVPLRFARELTGYSNEVSAVEIGLSPDADMDEMRDKIQAATGDKYDVKTRYQQHEFLYKVMKSEKWAVWLILSFILMIAVFNIIGSLSMLIIEKKKDIFILKSLGASRRSIRQIFMIEGVLINMIGALIGMSLGALICFLQMQFGLVSIEGGGSFVVTAYPVSMEVYDFVSVFLTVFIIGFAVSWLPVRQATKPGYDKDFIMMHK